MEQTDIADKLKKKPSSGVIIFTKPELDEKSGMWWFFSTEEGGDVVDVYEEFASENEADEVRRECIVQLVKNRSKDGNSQYNDFVIRAMIEFQGALLDVYDIKGTERIEEYNEKAPEGLDYVLTIWMKAHPFERTFRFQSYDDREEAFTKLKQTLQNNGFAIL